MTLDGKAAYHLGNICNTCEFLFERLDGATRSVVAEQLKEITEGNPSLLSLQSIEQVGALLPAGQYLPFYAKFIPRLVSPGREGDYFAGEQIETWGLNTFWGLPHHPKTEYYRGRTMSLPWGTAGNRALHEFVVPMFPHGWLNHETLSSYQRRHTEFAPTALAVSILDVKGPDTGDDELAVTEHWCLSHYLLDGHHKVFAAANSQVPVGVLSFLAVRQGVSSLEQASAAVARLAVPTAP